MAQSKKYWKNIEELSESSPVLSKLPKDEFAPSPDTNELLSDSSTLGNTNTSRRDFLKYVGFTTAVASLAACEGPVRKSIPYVVKPEEVTPGIANHYASTIADGYDFANVLVKTREGRPILLMPNKEANGETNARVQASVLSLYDSMRLKNPLKNNAPIDFKKANQQIVSALKKTDKKIILLTGTLASPSTYALIDELKSNYQNLTHIEYDAISDAGALDAFESFYGVRALPDYDLSIAKTIVSIGADFIVDWQGGGLEGAYAKGRQVNHGKLSRHIQIEANMSLTGANADKRIVLKPSDQIYALINLYNEITSSNVFSKKTPQDTAIKNAAKQLKKAGRFGVVMTGIQNKYAQQIALAINHYLKSEVMDVKNIKHTRKGNDEKVAKLIVQMKRGEIGALMTYQTNPVYTLAESDDFQKGLKKVPLTVGFSKYKDETASLMQYVLPHHHSLESWGDVEMTSGNYSLTQPTIKPLFDTVQFQDCLLKWNGKSENYYTYLRTFWKENILNGTSWNNALHDGFYRVLKKAKPLQNAVDINLSAQSLLKYVSKASFELVLYSSTAIGDGQQANNPWLQELPDPITRAAWDNYVTISPADAKKLGYENPVQDNGAIDGNYTKIIVGGVTLEKVPVLIQPGQAKGSIGLALGYGKQKAIKPEMRVGVNAYKLALGGVLIQKATLEKTAGTHQFACEQLHHTVAGRHDILKEVSLKDFKNPALDPKHTWNKIPIVSFKHEEVDANTIDLWDDQDRSIGHHFNLSIDLTTCTGCGACVVACHAENNVPVVGKHEVRVGRDMHWLRIDRYYSSEVDDQKSAKEQGLSGGDMYHALERVSENPQVTFQPVMCQHCNHAPCETVCPVAATSHGRQGQNHMAYNRCVGTRYCANNCPYRVRRFNWFKYNENPEFDFHMNDDYGRMVLNPDVVVRSRGVMEKCSFCIQSTQAVILNAKKEGRKVKKGEFNDACACAAACSTGAMVFGDVNESQDDIVSMREDKRAYRLLEHLGTDNNVVYQVKVRNTEEV